MKLCWHLRMVSRAVDRSLLLGLGRNRCGFVVVMWGRNGFDLYPDFFYSNSQTERIPKMSSCFHARNLLFDLGCENLFFGDEKRSGGLLRIVISFSRAGVGMVVLVPRLRFEYCTYLKQPCYAPSLGFAFSHIEDPNPDSHEHLVLE